MIFESYAPYIPIMGKIPPTIFEDFIEHINKGNLWFLEYNGSKIGMVILTPCDDYLLLQSMCILPLYQKLGLSKKILKFSEELAKSKGLCTIKLYTNSLMKRNQKIYKKCGYKETHRNNYDWGIRVYMEKAVKLRTKKKLAITEPGFQCLSNALC